MKLELTIVFLVAVSSITPACQQKDKRKGAKATMEMDSLYASDKNVTIVHDKDTIRLVESMKNFEDNPNITGADIDAGKKTPSSEVQYVGPNDTIRLGEPTRKKAQ